MSNVIPFRRSPPDVRPIRPKLVDGIDKETGKPVFGIELVDADGLIIDSEFFDTRAERDAEIFSWGTDWGVDVSEVFGGVDPFSGRPA
ncbi:MAG: hypothetical protein WBH00_11675 [Xanthobacteraceae bacterium]